VGRLFWKFFIFFWLAQVTTAIGVGMAMWLHSPEMAQFHAPPPAPGEVGFAPPAYLPPDGRMGPPPHNRGMLPPLVPLLAGSLVSLVFAALLAWYFSKPIRKLRSAFDALANGDMDVRLAPVMGSRRDELADLGRDFDSMAQRLQQLMDGQRRVLHDVSHELRSPLARLQAAIGLARQQPERMEDSMVRIEQEGVRMDALVSELLTLSRLEVGMTGKLDEEVDLNELVFNVVEDARFETGISSCRIEFEECCRVAVMGNAELLHRAVENVVRNAVKHSPSNSLISIKMYKADAQMVCIAVSDDGLGVPEADMQSIFEPFFRSDATKTTSGHGLGLTIAHRVVTAHQGSISASNCTNGGLCITITLSARPAA
jgi:two-component system OmpR family sensor kinase